MRLLNLRERLRQTKAVFQWIIHCRRKQYISQFFIIAGFLLLIDHLYNAGYTWDLNEWFTCHGFIGFLLIIIGFILGIKQNRLIRSQ